MEFEGTPSWRTGMQWDVMGCNGIQLIQSDRVYLQDMNRFMLVHWVHFLSVFGVRRQLSPFAPKLGGNASP